MKDNYQGIKNTAAKIRDLCQDIMFEEDPSKIENLCRSINDKTGSLQRELNSIRVVKSHGKY